MKLLLFELGVDKTIDRFLFPERIRNVGRKPFSGSLQAPPTSPFGELLFPFFGIIIGRESDADSRQ